MKFGTKLLTVALAMIAVGCSSDLGNNNTASSATSTPSQRTPYMLTVNPNPATVQASQSITLTASGGLAPYTFHLLIAGTTGCSINPTTGVLTAPSIAGACNVYVTDASTGTGILIVTVTVPQVVMTYAWQAAGFGTCSATCGGGTQSQTVTCMSSVGTAVADGLCTAAKPATSQTCNPQACPPTWHQVGWTGAIGRGNLSGLCAAGVTDGAVCTSSAGTWCYATMASNGPPGFPYATMSCY